MDSQYMLQIGLLGAGVDPRITLDKPLFMKEMAVLFWGFRGENIYYGLK